MDVAHAILLYGKIDFSRLTADYLSAKFEFMRFYEALPIHILFYFVFRDFIL